MPLLSISNLALGYGAKEVFSGINAEEEEGMLIALLGPNGRGKSTLLRTIAGLEPQWCPDNRKNGNHSLSSTSAACNDSILYSGKRLKDCSQKEISRLVSFVSPLSDRTRYLSIKDMLSINSYFRTNWLGALSQVEESGISDALNMVGLQGFEDRDCTSLSDGEFQRACIAGAIVQDSRIILLDEPTAFLDIANKFLITRLLKQIAHNKKNKKLIIFSTHDLQLALQICDKFWVMSSEGFLCGTQKEITENKAIENMFNIEGVKFDLHKMMFVE